MNLSARPSVACAEETNARWRMRWAFIRQLADDQRLAYLLHKYRLNKEFKTLPSI